MTFKTSKTNNYIRLSLAALVIIFGLFIFQNPLFFILIVFLLSDRLRGIVTYNIENDVVTIIKTKEDIVIKISDVVAITHYRNAFMGSIPLPAEYALKTADKSYTIKSKMFNEDGVNLVDYLQKQYQLELIEEALV